LYAPRDGQTYKADTPITFTGGGYSPDQGTCGFDEVSWHSHIQGYLGSGNQFVKTDLMPGTHRITMSLPDGEGDEAKASVWIKVIDKEHDAANHNTRDEMKSC
jgi:hypothetical protein